MASSQTEDTQCAHIISSDAALQGTKPSSSIARQTSIYTLTLDEFQNVLGEPGKSFGSMNMDEFLKNIWTVEESQAMAAAIGGGVQSEELWHHGVQRQASISLPRTLSRKTVDDVWKEIACGSIDMDPAATATGTQDRQVTFGEMTLEDFLVKAGVVKNDDSGNDSGNGSMLPFAMGFENPFAPSSAAIKKSGDRFGPSFSVDGEKPRVLALPLLSLSGPNTPSSQAGLDFMKIDNANNVSEWLPSNGFKKDLNYIAHPPTNGMLHQHASDINYTRPPPDNILHQHAMEASARKGVGNGALIGGLGVLGPDMGVGLAEGTIPACPSPTASLALKTGSPQSPLLDGIVTPYDSMSMHSPLPYGVDGVMRGRKREFEGSLEKVVERRQKRMIKNRESAARSRARKQAYTVELEAEVSYLKEENLRLRRHEEELAEQRRKQLIDVLTSFGPSFGPKGSRLRRTHTGPW